MERSKISEIVYNYTMFDEGKYRIYLNLGDLNFLLNEIIQTYSTTEYIRITPFYLNEKYDTQIEFEDEVFFLECRNELEKEPGDDIVIERTHPIVYDFDIKEIFINVCRYDDITRYHYLINQYQEYLFSS